MDDLLLEKQESLSRESETRRAKANREQELEVAGNNIRQCALNRLRNGTDSREVIDVDIGAVSNSGRKKRRCDVVDDLTKIALESVEKQAEVDEINILLSSKKLKLKEEAIKKEEDRFHKSIELQERKIALEETKWEEEKKDREHRRNMEEQQLKSQQGHQMVLMEVIKNMSAKKD